MLHVEFIECLMLEGGGFGGKETRATVIALPAAIAAHKYVIL